MKKNKLKFHILKNIIGDYEISTIIGGIQLNSKESNSLIVDSINQDNRYLSRDGEFHRDSK